MSGKLTAALVAILTLILFGFGFVAFHYQAKAAGLEKDKTILTGERDVAQFTLGNYTTTVRLFNDIAKANENDKQKIAQAGEARVVYIREAIKGDDCTNKPVPAAAADLLRKHANQIRSGATGTDTSKLTF